MQWTRIKTQKEREGSEKLMEAVVKGLLEDAATEKPELDKPIPLQQQFSNWNKSTK